MTSNKWIIIDPKLLNVSGISQFHLLSTSSCLQINESDIFIFGGYLEDNTGSKQTFLLSFEDENDYTNATIRFINWKMLPFGEGFWQNQSIIFERKLFAIQNISNQTNDDCLEDVRRVLSFDESQWNHY